MFGLSSFFLVTCKYIHCDLSSGTHGRIRSLNKYLNLLEKCNRIVCGNDEMVVKILTK